MAFGVTRRSSELLVYISAYQGRNGGQTPSFRQMGDALGIKSKGDVHRLVSNLEVRGNIRRLHRRARAIEVITRPTIPLLDARDPATYLHLVWDSEKKALAPLAQKAIRE